MKSSSLKKDSRSKKLLRASKKVTQRPYPHHYLGWRRMSADEFGRALKEAGGMKVTFVWLELGHIQRGGSPTARDRVLTSRMEHTLLNCCSAWNRWCSRYIRNEKMVENPTLVKAEEGALFLAWQKKVGIVVNNHIKPDLGLAELNRSCLHLFLINSLTLS